MKTILIFLLLASGLVIPGPGVCQFVTRTEATMIANKYIQAIIANFGPWDGQMTAFADPAQNLYHNGLLVGYYSQVSPDGWIVMPLRREFGSVKASSDQGFFDPGATGGPLLLIKERLAAHVNAVESRYGPIESATVADVESLLSFSGRESWSALASFGPGSLVQPPVVTDNYTEGQVLLTTSWDQEPPYNNDCPYLGCLSTSNGNALVGCVATAGAQLMRFWAWPPINPGNPADPYDWPNMKDDVSVSSPAWQQSAVAELSYDVGAQVGMDYGCTSSSAATLDMIGVYAFNLYNEAAMVVADRSDFTASEWFTLIKGNINLNRPIQYRIGSETEGHSIVCDGWREYGNTWEYHMNYGWDDTYTNWYAIDNLYNSDPDEEFMILNISPYCALGPVVSGNYVGGYRYIDMEASGTSAYFFAGSVIQMHPLCSLKGTGTGGSNVVRINGNATLSSLIYSDGNSICGTRIYNGQLILKNNGMIRVYKQEDW
jgi:hypothetical protein